MAEIKLLDKSVAELIAAGEVIEKPASVIKEIVENSIDAGAKHITVEIKNGGITYMRVCDDGCGMSYEDVPTAFLRHATSKLRTAEELDCIYTMGFRGEALASIAAVSRAELLTKRECDDIGTRFMTENGECRLYEKSGCPDGTTIIIRDLFFNTPARLKFMKKDVTEGNSVQAVVDKLALAHPEISFRFIRDNKQVRVTTGDGKFYSAIYAVFGKQFAASLIPVDFSQGRVSVGGFVSSPNFCRANRAMQYFFVNTRSIRNTTCMAALEEGFRNSIMTGKFPACVLNIEVPPDEVDVNVSPSKTEVRFSGERMIFEAVYMAVKNAILNAENSREIVLPEVKPKQAEEPPRVIPAERVFNTNTIKPVEYAQPVTPAKTEPEPELAKLGVLRSSRPIYNPVPPERIYAQERLEPEHRTANTENPYKFISKESFRVESPEQRPKCEPAPIAEEEKQTPPLRVVGELFKTYILCEAGNDLILIDKHAAHERIRFEKLKKDFVQHAQLLAESETVQLSSEEFSAVCENIPLLTDMGIDVIPGDDFKVEINALPTLLGSGDPREIVEKIADILLKNNSNTAGEIFDDMLHTFACKSAIKAHDETSDYELQYLAETVWNDEKIRFCPHGRPIITTISKYTLEKSFNRIQ